MNPGLDAEHPSIRYYDGDYPSPFDDREPGNFDEVVEGQGIAHDLERYLGLAAETGGPVLDLCCGTGRAAIPLARAGHAVTAVDISEGMLERLRGNLERESGDTRSRIEIVRQDVSALDLARRVHPLAVMAFNSLLCIPSFGGQCAALAAAARHLAPGGVIALDLVNPLQLKIHGDPTPKPFFTRKHPETGNVYTRFAMVGPFDTEHRQRLYGWYDELDSEGRLRRTHYAMLWRPIFRFELELMLEGAGLRLESLEGGHRREAFTAASGKMFALARRL
jgi:SAM-dependent methyltransferase